MALSIESEGALDDPMLDNYFVSPSSNTDPTSGSWVTEVLIVSILCSHYNIIVALHNTPVFAVNKALGDIGYSG